MKKIKLTGISLEQAIRDSHDIGENMAIMHTQGESVVLINKLTGVAREFVDCNGFLSVPDEDIDFDAIEKGCPHYRRPSRALDYGGLGRWTDFKGGICALSWTIYPDGIYFADEDGYGMEDNREEDAYCIIDTDLNTIVPFRPMNASKELERLRAEREQKN